KCTPAGVAAPEAPYEIGQRAGHEKIFLHEAQALPQAGRIIRVEYSRERFSFERLGHCANELTVAECLEIEIIGCGSSPEAKGIDGLAAIADYRTIEGDARQAGRLANDGTQAPTADLEGAVQPDFNCLVQAGNLPRVLTTQPVVRLFLLPAIPD